VSLVDGQGKLDGRLARAGARGHRAMVAGVIREGRATVSGWASDGPAPDGSSLFEIGSITKAFTGVLLAEMHLRGEVSLDDPLSKHLPGPRPRWRDGEPSLRDLATHRSGLPNVPGGLGRRELLYTLGVGDASPWSRMTQDGFAALVAAETPRRPRAGHAASRATPRAPRAGAGSPCRRPPAPRRAGRGARRAR